MLSRRNSNIYTVNVLAKDVDKVLLNTSTQGLCAHTQGL